jgi:hypothetical protein
MAKAMKANGVMASVISINIQCRRKYQWQWPVNDGVINNVAMLAAVIMKAGS